MMENTFPWFFWLFPVALTIHNIEEAIYLPEWSKSAGKYHKQVGAFEFRLALIIITALAVIITYLLYKNPKQSFVCYLHFGYNFGMFINVFFPHLAGTIVLRKYASGLLTGIIFLVPVTGYILFYGYNNGYYQFPMFWYITIPFAAAMVGLLPVLFKTGRLIQGYQKNTIPTNLKSS